MSAQVCPTCQAPLAENARFCSNCGQTLSQANSTVSNQSPVVMPAPPTYTTPTTAIAPQQQQQLIPQQPHLAQPVQPQPAQFQPTYIPQTPSQPPQINVTVNTTAQTVNQSSPVNVVLIKQKSMLVAFLLTFFFGPFGVFYVSIIGALIWIFVSIALTIATGGGFGFFAWIISIVWAMVATANYNKNIIITR